MLLGMQRTSRVFQCWGLEAVRHSRARLDTFRQAGESLAGRYHRWRMHPFSVRELCAQTRTGADDALDALLRFGGFPDSAGEDWSLNHLRTSNGKEIDFMVTNAAGDATHFIEVKWSDAKPSFALRQMAQTHPGAQAIKLVRQTRHAFDLDGVGVRPAAQWLADLAA